MAPLVANVINRLHSQTFLYEKSWEVKPGNDASGYLGLLDIGLVRGNLAGLIVPLLVLCVCSDFVAAAQVCNVLVMYVLCTPSRFSMSACQ